MVSGTRRGVLGATADRPVRRDRQPRQGARSRTAIARVQASRPASSSSPAPPSCRRSGRPRRCGRSCCPTTASRCSPRPPPWGCGCCSPPPWRRSGCVGRRQRSVRLGSPASSLSPLASSPPPRSPCRCSASCRRTTTGRGRSLPSCPSPSPPASCRCRRWRRRCGWGRRRVAGSSSPPLHSSRSVVAAWPRYPVASVAYDEVESRRVGQPLRAEFAAAVDAGAVGDEVEVDLSRAFFGNDYPYVMLAELQRAGIEFRFVPDSRNLDRFGRLAVRRHRTPPAAAADLRAGPTARRRQRGGRRRGGHER